MNDNKPQVKLISKPDNILKTIYTACRTCYSADTPLNIFDKDVDEEKMMSLIKRVIGSGHYSTIEHIQVSFAISNISRACTHQLVRHRHMSFSQKSQRYVKEKGQFDFLIPLIYGYIVVEIFSFLSAREFNTSLQASIISNGLYA